MIWHNTDAARIAHELAADTGRGLADDDAAQRRRVQGANALTAAPDVTALQILLRQFRSVVVWTLLGAAAVSLFVGELVDGLAIAGIIILNAAIGFVQEHRAERAVAALTRMVAPRARVLRAGRPRELPATEVVTGDILLLDAGDLVAADARLIDAAVLRTNEASLTGESTPVAKDPAVLPADTPLADRRGMVFLGTSVASGSARAIVVATGMATEMGHIATLLQQATVEQTPLQRELDRIGRLLLLVCLVIVATVAALGLGRGEPPLDIFLAAVSLAVAAIPEGLPAIITVALALGVQRMARRKALVRRLPAVETLGSAEVVCTDKTGTLTVGAMTSRYVVTCDRVVEVTGEGYVPVGQFLDDRGAVVETDSDPVLQSLLSVAAGCVDAHLDTVEGHPAIVGDPTEGALLVLAAKAGFSRPAVEASMPRLATLPFDTERRRMTVVRRREGLARVMTKGAPEAVIARCSRIGTRSGDRVLDDDTRAQMLATCDRLAGSALRVLALATREVPGEAVPADVEHDLTLLGLVAMYDPPRAEAREAVDRCRRAGITPVMITGDHPDTAQAIGRTLGILRDGDRVVTGSELDTLDDDALNERLAHTTVFARVTAEHKLRIVRAWRRRDVIVAMTGDGVNDAPALEEADIGVAMGVTGTEVTKQAADLILLDDDFATIVAAIEEGRGIYDNIGNTLAYLVTGNAAELSVMLVAGVLGWPLPLLPIHLLWINLVTDGLPALVLATEPTAPHVLERRPRRRDARMTDARFLRRTLATAALATGVTLLAFAVALEATGDAAAARSAAFTVLVFEELLRSFAARSTTHTIGQMGPLSSPRLVLVVALGLATQVALLGVPWLAAVFQTVPMSLGAIAGCLALATVPLLGLELGKIVRRARQSGTVSRSTATAAFHPS